MEVTRTSLRAERNPIPKQVRQGEQTQQRGGYGEEVKQKLETLGDVRRKAPVIQAKRVDPVVSQTEQYTKDAVKTAMEKLKKFIVNQGLGGDKPGDTEKPATFASTGGGGGIGTKDFFSGFTNDQLGLLSTQQLVDRDNRMYGDTFPDGAIGIGSKSTDDFSKNPEYQSTAGDFEKERLAKVMSSLPSDYKQTEQRAFDDAEAYRRLVASGLDKTVSGEDAQVNVGPGNMGTFGFGTLGKGAPSGDDLKPGSFGISTIKRDDQADRMGGQGGLALGTTTQRQGGTVKDGIKVAKKISDAVNASGFLQKNIRGGGKDESARPAQVKQTVASLPSNYKSTEKAAFDKAKSWQDSKALGKAAEKATGIQTKPVAGSFGISEAGKAQAEANKAEKKKATPAQKTAIKKATAVKKSSPSTSTSTSKSGRKSNTGSKKSSRGGKSSGGGSKSGGSKSGGSKSNTGSKKASRGASGSSSSRSKGGASKGGSKGTSGSKKASRGTSGSSSRGGTSRGTSRRTNRRRSRRRCDIRCKFDISILTNQNLIRDDLADVAYFVKDLQEIN